MKNIKNIFISILSIVALFSLQVSVASSNQFAEKSAALLKQTQGPGFEIFNKSPNPITIAAFIGKETVTKIIFPNEKFLKTISLDVQIRLGIYDGAIDQNINFSVFKNQITPEPKFMFDIGVTATGKTKYLTWNPAKKPSLYPQTGPLMGMLGKTESGYPLEINLKQSDIKQVRQS